jgi:hypothetical protein
VKTNNIKNIIFTTFAISPPGLKRGFLSLVQQYADYRYIEIIKGSAIVVISSKKELILVNFVSQISPYIKRCRKYMFQSDIASASGQC